MRHRVDPPAIRPDATGQDIVTRGEFVELGYRREQRNLGAKPFCRRAMMWGVTSASYLERSVRGVIAGGLPGCALAREVRRWRARRACGRSHPTRRRTMAPNVSLERQKPLVPAAVAGP